MKKIENLDFFYEVYCRHQMAFAYEVETKYVARILPPGLHPLEVRPGVSLLNLGFSNFYEGNLIGGEVSPSFCEITRGVVVHPNLDMDIPMPVLSYFIYFAASNYKKHVEYDKKTLFLPLHYMPTQTLEYNESKTHAKIKDDDGVIQEWKNTNPDLEYEVDDFLMQYYTAHEGKLYCGVFREEVRAFSMHQKKGNAGGLRRHLCALETEQNLPTGPILDPYIQMSTKYDTLAIQKFCKPVYIRDLKP